MRAARGLAVSSSHSADSISPTNDSVDGCSDYSGHSDQPAADIGGIHTASNESLATTSPEEHRPLSPQMELRLRLLPRIGEYKSRGWINALEEREYIQLLTDTSYQQHHGDDREDLFDPDQAAVQVKRALDLVERRVMEKVINGNAGGSGGNRHPASAPKSSSRNLKVSFEKELRSPASDISDSGKTSEVRQQYAVPPPLPPRPKAQQRTRPDKTVTPKEPLHETTKDDVPCVYTPKDMIRQLQPNAKVIEDLFVEMCFFARLGFLQPPSCLMCAYRDGVVDGKRKTNDPPRREEQSAPSSCRRVVAWRKDAEALLHPDGLDGNVIFVTCDAARLLLKDGGKARGLDGSMYSWDRADRCMLISEALQ